ncbi:MAG: DUF1697 domain-containing protein [bacterium]|nr:DUF1697 domain-containing protein [bacterium]
MPAFTALLRGINVGRAKRIAMADLRRLFADLGYADVRTLLNSGNVVFAAKSPDAAGHARAIRAAIEREFGFTAPVIVVTAADLAAILLENPCATWPTTPRGTWWLSCRARTPWTRRDRCWRGPGRPRPSPSGSGRPTCGARAASPTARSSRRSRASRERPPRPATGPPRPRSWRSPKAAPSLPGPKATESTDDTGDRCGATVVARPALRC